MKTKTCVITKHITNYGNAYASPVLACKEQALYLYEKRHGKNQAFQHTNKHKLELKELENNLLNTCYAELLNEQIKKATGTSI